VFRDPWFRLVGAIGTARWMRHLHAPLYRRFEGRGVLGRSLGNLTVVLATTGAQTGRRRETAIWAYRDGDRLVVIGSNGGSNRLPGWVANLRAYPDAEVLVGRHRQLVRAHEATGSEYERLWRLANAAYAGYDRYQVWARRPIPVVVLEPRTATRGGTAG
jgi:deazaflavin-dependent oxidoreductase (nitroreductase family)